jgi:hypothetical protein
MARTVALKRCSGAVSLSLPGSPRFSEVEPPFELILFPRKRAELDCLKQSSLAGDLLLRVYKMISTELVTVPA